MTWQIAAETAERLPTAMSSQLRHRRLLRQDVYDVLVAEFINGDFTPGERIRDDEVAQRLNVSRTPVREALAKLATAGLVDTAPNRYTRTTHLYEGDLVTALELLAGVYRIGLVQIMSELTETDDQMLDLLARRVGSATADDAYAVVQVFGRFCAERMTSVTVHRIIEIVQPRLQRVLRMNSEILHVIDGIDAVQQLIAALRERNESQLHALCDRVLSETSRAIIAASE